MIGLKVQDLETQLRTTQEELQALQDIDAQLNHQLMMETNLQGIYITALRMDRPPPSPSPKVLYKDTNDGETKGDDNNDDYDNNDNDDEEDGNDDGANGESKSRSRGMGSSNSRRGITSSSPTRSNGSMSARHASSRNSGSNGLSSVGPTSDPSEVAQRRGRRGSWADHLSAETRRMIEGRLHPRIRAKLDAEKAKIQERRRRKSQANATLVANTRAEANAATASGSDDEYTDHSPTRDAKENHDTATATNGTATSSGSNYSFSFRHKFRLPPPTHAERPISPDDLPTEPTSGDGLLHRKLKPSLPHFSFVRTTPRRPRRRVSITDDEDDELDLIIGNTPITGKRSISPLKALPSLRSPGATSSSLSTTSKLTPTPPSYNNNNDPNAVVVIAGGAARRSIPHATSAAAVAISRRT
jgi:hypothetical protein